MQIGSLGALGIGLADVVGNRTAVAASNDVATSFGKAKSCILLFPYGSPSSHETFDPKPALVKYGNQTYDETPLPNPTKDPLFKLRSRAVVGGDRPHSKILLSAVADVMTLRHQGFHVAHSCRF